MAGIEDEKSEQPERRKHVRRLVCIPAYVDTEKAPQHIALIRDISLSGAYFLTRVSLEVGDKLDIALHLTGDPGGRVHDTSATVVRAEVLEPERADLWTCGVAVQFEDLLKGIEEEIEELATRLAQACA